MGLPGYDDDGTARTSKKSGYDDIVGDIRGPERVVRVRSSRWTALALQLVFGYVGGGYFYLGDRRMGVLSAVAFVLGAATIIYLEMLVFPSASQVNWSLMWVHYAAVGVFFVLALAYLASVWDCFQAGARLERKFVASGVQGSLVAREPSPQEKIERVFSEHDRNGFDEPVQ